MHNPNTLNLSRHKSQAIIWILLCLMPIVGMAVDLVAPSLPSIVTNLHVEPAMAKNVISIYLLGYAFGNLIIGLLTDALGRQKLLRIGLVGFILASMLPVIYPQIEILLLARLLQGLTIGSIAVVARAIFSDILSPEKLIKTGVLIGSMFGLGPVIGPLIGGYLQFYFGWQACFVFFVISMLILGTIIFFVVPETISSKHELSVNKIKNDLYEILTHKKFMALVIMMGAVYSLIIAFNTVGPFLIQTKFNYSPIFFGHIALLLGIVFLFSTFICRYLLRTETVENLFLIFINSFFVFAIMSLVLEYILGNNIVLVIIASSLMFFICGFIFPMSMGKGLSLFRHIAGTATATMYFINILMTSITAFILSFISIQNAIALGFVYVVILFICVVTYWVGYAAMNEAV